MSTALQDFLLYKQAAPRLERVRPHSRGGKPVQGYVRTEEGEQALRTRQQRDLDMWRTWKSGGQKPEDLRPLLQAFDGMIQGQAAVFKGRVRVPPAAIDAEYKRQFLAALEHYDPDKGSLGTYVYQYLSKSKRFIANHQNMARIPESRIYKIQEFQVGQKYLDEQLGRPPTHEELSAFLGWKPAEVARLTTELRKDISSSQFLDDPGTVLPSRAEEVLRLVQYELTPEELQVFRHTFGVSGAPSLTPGQIAAKLHMAPSKVSRLRKKISEKVERYLR